MVELVNELHRLAVTPTSVGIDPRRLSSHQMKAVKRVEDELDRIKPSAFKSVMFSIDDPAGRTKVRLLSSDCENMPDATWFPAGVYSRAL